MKTLNWIKKHFMQWLGIPEIELERAARTPNERVDQIFLADLGTLESLRTLYLVDLQHLESRHQFLMAIVEAGPYAVITSIVALGWALASEETVIAPTAAIAVILSALVVLCNRLDNPVEGSMVKAKLGLSRIDERYSIREKEVQDAYEKYNTSKTVYFDGFFSISFTKHISGLKGMVQNWIPNRDSQIVRNMRHRHPDTFRSMEDLEKASLKFFDGAEQFRKMIHLLLTDKIDEKMIGDHNKEEWLDEIARALIHCISKNIRNSDDLKKGEIRGEIDPQMAISLRRIFSCGYDALLDNEDLKKVALDTEHHRISAGQLAADIGREISTLYGGEKRTGFSPGL